MGKLSDELPIIKLIKQKMSKDDNFTHDQVRDFERRVGRTYSLRFLIQMLQRFDEKIKENDEERDEKAKSQKLAEDNSMLRRQNERLKKRITELEKI
jgi:cell shape-determining protein MreC